MNIFSGHESTILNYSTVVLEQTTGYVIFLITVMSNPINLVVLEFCKDTFNGCVLLAKRCFGKKPIKSYNLTSVNQASLLEEIDIIKPSSG